MILRKLETEPGPRARMAGLAVFVSRRLGAPGFAAGPFSRPASGSNQRAGGEDAPAWRGVKAWRLERMRDQGQRGDRKGGQEGEVAEGHREAIDQIEERVVHCLCPSWCCSAAFGVGRACFQGSLSAFLD